MDASGIQAQFWHGRDGSDAATASPADPATDFSLDGESTTPDGQPRAEGFGAIDDDYGPITLPTRRAPGCPFDPPAEFALIRSENPLVRMAFPDGHRGWLATGHHTVRAILADDRFSARTDLQHHPLLGGVEQAPVAAPGQLSTMDPPQHTRYRRLLTRHFSAARMRKLEPRVRESAAECLDTIQRCGSPADLVRSFASPISIHVIGELLGIPRPDRKISWEPAADLQDADAPHAGFEETAQYLQDLVARRRTEPTDDLLGALVAEEALTDQELVNIGMMLFVGGTETTSRMIALGVFALLEEGPRFAALSAEVADTAIDELLRHLTVLTTPARVALHDLELDGHLVRQGETVVMALAAANRDPDRFLDPDRLDLARPNAVGHLAFGHGAHRCLGQHLARIELRVAYRALFERFPTLRLAIPADEVDLDEGALVYGPSSLPVTWDGSRPPPS